MSDWQREQDRELWRAAQYSHVYGREYAQNYLAWSQALPGIAIAIIVCLAFPAILLIPLGILLLWGGIAAFHAIRDAGKAKASREAQEAAIARHQAAVDRLLHDLQVALGSGNDAGVGEICKIVAQEEAFGLAIPLLRVALGDNDPCLRLCAVRGLRWGTRFIDTRSDQGGIQVVLENMPSLLLIGVFSNPQETTQLRVAAAIALGNGGYLGAFSTLLRSISDPNPEVRAACCHALGRHMSLARGDDRFKSVWASEVTDNMRQEGIGAIIAALRDPHHRVLQEAAWALGESRNPRALRPLQQLAADRSQPESVRRAADDAAAAIKQGATL